MDSINRFVERKPSYSQRTIKVVISRRREVDLQPSIEPWAEAVQLPVIHARLNVTSDSLHHGTTTGKIGVSCQAAWWCCEVTTLSLLRVECILHLHLAP
eukprot:54333-Eustigmatos_ZCMA.PRE.1